MKRSIPYILLSLLFFSSTTLFGQSVTGIRAESGYSFVERWDDLEEKSIANLSSFSLGL